MQGSRLYGHWDHTNTIYSIRMHQNSPFCMKNRPKMAVFWPKIDFFGFRQASEDHPPYFEGAGCGESGCRGI